MAGNTVEGLAKKKKKFKTKLFEFNTDLRSFDHKQDKYLYNEYIIHFLFFVYQNFTL